MSSFVQDNLDRFNKIQGDYNSIANSIGNLTSRDADNDLKSKIENIGSGVESGANLYMEGRKMIHELKGRKVQKNIADTLREAGDRNAQHLIKNNNTLLVYTFEKLTQNKKVFEDLLNFKIENRNVNNGLDYLKFRCKVIYKKDYLDRLLFNKTMNFFYSKKDIDLFYNNAFST